MSLSISEPDAPETHTPPSALGIDLGTTHSLVSIINKGQACLLPLNHGVPGKEQLLMPSLVGWNGTTWDVGFAAETLQKSASNAVVSSLKRLMGLTSTAEVTFDFPFPLTDDPKRGLCLDFGTAHLTPTEGATLLLKTLCAAADKALARMGYAPLREAVITVPAYFDERARAATRLAAENAGLTVLRLISEPTAAALAYGLDESTEGLWGVYDLGGGTFDFSLLSMEKGVFNVLAAGGNTHLGGDDLDLAVARHLGAEEDRHTARRLKEYVSTRETDDPRLTRQDLERLSAPLIDRTLDLVRGVLRDADVEVPRLKGIILAGGATRTWGLTSKLQTALGHTPLCSLNPDHVVAMGAARQAEALSAGGAKHLLLDITPLTLSLETMGGVVEPLIKRNTRIPVRATQTFTTSVTNQTALLLHVLQGEHEKVADCRSLARFELNDLPPLPAGEGRIEVIFHLDRDGLLSVTATEQTTGKTAHVTLKPAYGLTLETAKTLIQAS